MNDVFSVSSQLVEEVLPDFASVVFAEFAVIERNMDTGNESVVEGANAIGCQEEDALTIFHCTEEAYAPFVSMVILTWIDIRRDRGSKK